jgi:hypothetical protein
MQTVSIFGCVPSFYPVAYIMLANEDVLLEKAPVALKLIYSSVREAMKSYLLGLFATADSCYVYRARYAYDTARSMCDHRPSLAHLPEEYALAGSSDKPNFPLSTSSIGMITILKHMLIGVVPSNAVKGACLEHALECAFKPTKIDNSYMDVGGCWSFHNHVLCLRDLQVLYNIQHDKINKNGDNTTTTTSITADNEWPTWTQQSDDDDNNNGNDDDDDGDEIWLATLLSTSSSSSSQQQQQQQQSSTITGSTISATTSSSNARLQRRIARSLSSAQPPSYIYQPYPMTAASVAAMNSNLTKRRVPQAAFSHKGVKLNFGPTHTMDKLLRRAAVQLQDGPEPVRAIVEAFTRRPSPSSSSSSSSPSPTTTLGDLPLELRIKILYHVYAADPTDGMFMDPAYLHMYMPSPRPFNSIIGGLERPYSEHFYLTKQALRTAIFEGKHTVLSEHEFAKRFQQQSK